jgi:hypothetical protein
MSFVIICQNNTDKSRERILLPDRVITQAQANEWATNLVKRYPKYGYDAMHDLWWARDEREQNFTFWIEPGA